MSGGAYDYQYSRIGYLAEELERQLENNFIEEQESWRGGFETKEKIDLLGDASPDERVKIVAELIALVVNLREVAFRAKEFEWYQSGDTGATSYLKRLADSLKLKGYTCTQCNSVKTYKTEAIYCKTCCSTTPI